MTLILRNTIRLIDFENTKNLMIEKKWENLCTVQLSTAFIIFIFLLIFFKPSRNIKITNVMMLFYLNVISFVNVPDEIFQTMMSYFILVNMGYVFSFFMGIYIHQIIDNMDITIADINKFKFIFENQSEAVIIVSGGDKIDYVNNKFLSEFETEIMKIYDAKVDDVGSAERENENYGSRTRKMTQLIKWIKAGFHNKCN